MISKSFSGGQFYLFLKLYFADSLEKMSHDSARNMENPGNISSFNKGILINRNPRHVLLLNMENNPRFVNKKKKEEKREGKNIVAGFNNQAKGIALFFRQKGSS